MRRPGRLATASTFALLILVWGTTWAAIRIGLEGIPPFTGIALRFLVASSLLFLLSPVMGVRYGSSAVERRLWLINGLLSFCVSYGVVYWSEQWVPSGLASVLFATFPLFVAILAHFALPAERLTTAAVAGILVGFGGVAVGAVFMREPVTARTFTGSAPVVAGVALAVHARTRPRRNLQDEALA